MSEQRFVLDKLYYTIMTPIEKISVGRCYMTYREVVDTLNEQQSIITKLKELNDDKGKRIISLIRINKTLKEENLIFDFCKWLGSQGLLYEVIYYGGYDEIKEVIDKYLAEKVVDDE